MLFGCCISPKDYKAAEAAGFDFVEFPGAEIAAMTDREFAQVCETVWVGNVPCLFFNSYCKKAPAIVGDRFDVEKARAYAEHLCSRAKMLGVQMIGIGAPAARRLPADYDKNLADAQCRTFLKVTAEVAKRRGVQINFESLNPHVCEYGTSTKHAGELVQSIGLNNLALVVDFYHRRLAGEPICDFSGLENLISHTHISTCGPQRERGFPNMKELPYYAEILAGLKAAGYNGTMSIEAPAENLLEQGAAALEMLRLADAERDYGYEKKDGFPVDRMHCG